MGSVMMSSIKYKGMYQFDPIKGMPAGHMKNDQFFVIRFLLVFEVNQRWKPIIHWNRLWSCSRDNSYFSRLQGLLLALVSAWGAWRQLKNSVKRPIQIYAQDY